MVDRDLVCAKAGAIARHLDRVRSKRDVPLDVFVADLDRQESVLFNLQMAVQGCIDLAAHLVSDLDLGVAGSTSELFYLLEREGILDPALVEQMVRAVGFRNLLVHEYARIDLGQVHRIAQDVVATLESFLAVIGGRWL
ncbi:MAG: DUF86 domain-containing protein [Thermodesulfobacteriota bacterium]